MNYAIFTIFLITLDLASRSPLQLAPMSFQCVPIIFGAFSYILVPQGIPNSFSTFTAPALEWAVFSKKLWFFLLSSGIRDGNLGTWYAHYYWSVIASRPSQQTELGNICMYT